MDFLKENDQSGPPNTCKSTSTANSKTIDRKFEHMEDALKHTAFGRRR